MTAQEMALALKGASAELRDLVFRNVSENFAKSIREEIELMGPVRVSLVEEAQQKIASTVRRLVEEGLITIRRNEEKEQMI